MNSKWNDLREEYLPEAFVKKDFIKQGKKPMPYDPEDYLREMLNESSFFMDKTGGEKFHKPPEEAHGENDAVTENYEIDFKIVFSNSLQYARQNTSEQIMVNSSETEYFYARRQWSTYSKLNLWTICIIDMVIAWLYT